MTTVKKSNTIVFVASLDSMFSMVCNPFHIFRKNMAQRTETIDFLRRTYFPNVTSLSTVKNQKQYAFNYNLVL